MNIHAIVHKIYDKWKMASASSRQKKRKNEELCLLDYNDSDLSDSDNESESLSSDEFSITSSESEDEQYNLADARTWNQVPNTPCAPPRFSFLGKPGITQNVLQNDPSTLDFFELYFDKNLINIIVKETNRRYQQFISINSLKENSRVHKWKDTNEEEIRIFLSLILLQGIVQKPAVKWYWSKKQFIETPFFSKIMTEKRFSLLMKFLHFSNNEATSNDVQNPKLKKIWNVAEHLRKQFSSVYIPSRDICVDESLLLYKGRLGWIQYLPLKRARFGIKFFELCESDTGYVWDFIIYTGKNTDLCVSPENTSMGTKVVLSLANPLLGKGYCLTLDNFYNSPELSDILLKNKTDVFGTVKPNRKDMPPLQPVKLKKNETVAFQRGKVLVMKWKDKKDICLMSTVHNNSMIDIETRKGTVKKPIIVKDYNNKMGGVDRLDQMLSNYPAVRNKQRYYLKIFRHLLDMAVFNAYVLYKKSGGKFDHLSFRLDLIDKTIDKYYKPTTNAQKECRLSICDASRLTERHFIDHIPPTANQKEPRRRCYICCRKTLLGKKVRKETRYYCKECDVGLCITPCFRIYHTVKNL